MEMTLRASSSAAVVAKMPAQKLTRSKSSLVVDLSTKAENASYVQASHQHEPGSLSWPLILFTR